jgi:hypothetical protein
MFDTLSKCAEASKFRRETKGASVSVISGEEMVTIPVKAHKAMMMELGQLRDRNRNSKAASLNEDTITISKQEYRNLQDNKCANEIKQVVRKSRAASLQASGINQAQLIHNFIFSKY